MNFWQTIQFSWFGLQVGSLDELITFCQEYPMERISVWGEINRLNGGITVTGELGNGKVYFYTIIYKMADSSLDERTKAGFLVNRQIPQLEKQIRNKLSTPIVSNRVR